MPAKRRRIAPRQVRKVTPAAIEAWRKGDYWRLHHELGLAIWQMPDWGFDPPEENRHPGWPPAVEAYEHVCEMQRQLMEVAGPPPRRWYFRSVRHARKAS
jgi:hypothetical protein